MKKLLTILAIALIPAFAHAQDVVKVNITEKIIVIDGSKELSKAIQQGAWTAGYIINKNQIALVAGHIATHVDYKVVAKNGRVVDHGRVKMNHEGEFVVIDFGADPKGYTLYLTPVATPALAKK